MLPISDHHQYLFLGKLTNSLSPEEDQELTALFARDAAAVQAYEDLLRQLPAEQVAGSFSHLNTPGFWKDISGEVHDQQQLSYKNKIRKISVAVVLTALAAIGAWWLFPGRKNNVIHFAAHKIQPGSIELKLADGTMVDLSKVKGSLHKARLTLDNKDNALSYQATGESPVGLNTLSVPVAMDYKLNLPDGSEIWLNSASTVSFPTRFATGKREISITGEAYCRIAQNPGKPFIIHLPGNTVQVTGTEFNIDTYDPSVVKVALVAGGANLLSGETTVKLDPGYQGISRNGRIIQEPFEAQKVLSWRQGIFYFEAAGLDDLSRVLGRWFGIRTQLDEPSLADKKFVGALYKNRPLNSFLDNLKAISHINSYFDSRGVLHFTAVQ